MNNACQSNLIHRSARISATWLLPLLLLVLPAVVQAQYNCITNNGTITITGYTGPGGAVVIPSTLNGLPVTSIGGGAFWNYSGLTSVLIPSTVTNIASFAFQLCTDLTAIEVDALNFVYRSVDGVLFNKSLTTLNICPGGKAESYIIPNSVTSIDEGAFDLCRWLTSITIPNTVTNIGDSAFEGCFCLTCVTIPNSVTSLGYYAFYACSSLTNATIGDGVTSIGDDVFAGCSSLTSVTIPNGVTSIGGLAFWGCHNLTKVTLGNSLTNIGTWAFYATSLTSVAIPNSVTSIGAVAFAGCPRLSTITVDALNSSYSSLDGVLFDKNQTTLIQYTDGKARSYTIPSSVASIGGYAFAYSTRLTGLTSILDHAFAGCASLTSVTIPDSVTLLGERVFDTCTSLTNVTIGNGVTGIGDYAFYDCTNLYSTTIGSSVSSIGNGAFSDCPLLTRVYFLGNAPSADSTAFYFDNATVYYLPGTTGWASTFGGRPTAPWHLPNPVILDFGLSFGAQTNGFGFIISWATNRPVVIEASTNLSNPTWSAVATNTLTNGASYFSDPQWTNYPARFYRLRSP